jgi:hypothetical protein
MINFSLVLDLNNVRIQVTVFYGGHLSSVFFHNRGQRVAQKPAAHDGRKDTR